MALADQIALVNTTTHCLANPLAGMTMSGCVDHRAVVVNCAGSQNRWGHTTVIEQNFQTQCC
jgi:hypothetical protein